jgi:hypothetical protein
MGILDYFKRKANTTKRPNNTTQTTKEKAIFNPSSLKTGSFFSRTFGKNYGTGRFSQLRKATNEALRARTNGSQAMNIAAKANAAQEKYNSCGCEDLKKQIDANKAGLLTRLRHGKGIFSSATLGDIKAEELIAADKKVAEATRAAAQKFRQVQEKLVKAGALSQQLADKAIKEYEEKQKTADNAAKNAAKAHKNNVNTRKSKQNNAKWAGKLATSGNNTSRKNTSIASATRRAASAAAAAEKAKDKAANATADAAAAAPVLRILNGKLNNT